MMLPRTLQTPSSTRVAPTPGHTHKRSIGGTPCLDVAASKGAPHVVVAADWKVAPHVKLAAHNKEGDCAIPW